MTLSPWRVLPITTSTVVTERHKHHHSILADLYTTSLSMSLQHTPVALITGGTAGLGAATARLLAQDGMRVAVNYHSDVARATNLVQELHDISPLPHDKSNFLSFRADLGVRGELVTLVDDVIKSMGRLDAVFSNGGWTKIRDITDLDENVDEEDWDRCFNMNVKSHLFLMHAAKKHLEKTEGVFITTASLAGVKVSGSSLVSDKSRGGVLQIHTDPGQAYAVTKAAQIHLMKGLALAASPRIRVNSVSPGLMLTVIVDYEYESVDQCKADRCLVGLGNELF